MLSSWQLPEVTFQLFPAVWIDVIEHHELGDASGGLFAVADDEGELVGRDVLRRFEHVFLTYVPYRFHRRLPTRSVHVLPSGASCAIALPESAAKKFHRSHT